MMSRLLKSFSYAGSGVLQALWCQPNLRIHLLAAAIVIYSGLYFGLDRYAWCLVILAIGFVIVAETLNTALERLCDAVSLEYHPLLGQAKDISAAAVLIAACTAALVGMIIFLPHVLALFGLNLFWHYF